MPEGNGAPVVIKRVKKSGHGGHHGGAWKVAYADFVTAMMAFFLLLWLIQSASEEQKQAIAYYFTTGTVMDSSTAGGATILPGALSATGEEAAAAPYVGFNGSQANPYLSKEKQQYLANREQEMFDRAKIALEEALASDPTLTELMDNLVITKTDEGLHVQLIDQENQSIFASGSSELTPNGMRLTVLLAKVLAQMPQNIAIEGHTDAVPFKGAKGYSNWELSAARALAFRRRMVGLGVNDERIVRVAGQAAMQPYIPEDPTAPQNRRISMTFLSSFQKNAVDEAKKRALEVQREIEARSRQVSES